MAVFVKNFFYVLPLDNVSVFVVVPIVAFRISFAVIIYTLCRARIAITLLATI